MIQEVWINILLGRYARFQIQSKANFKSKDARSVKHVFFIEQLRNVSFSYKQQWSF